MAENKRCGRPNGILYSKKAYADAGVTELPKTYNEFLDVIQEYAVKEERMVGEAVTIYASAETYLEGSHIYKPARQHLLFAYGAQRASQIVRTGRTWFEI